MKNGWEKLDLIPITCQVRRRVMFKGVSEYIAEGDRTYLVVNVVVVCVVRAEHLQRVPWQPVTAVVVDGLESRDNEE